MIEKIGKKFYEKLSHPNETVINQIQELKNINSSINFCEVGIGIGATTLSIYQEMSSDDQIYLFDYEDKIIELKQDLYRQNNHGAEIITYSNSRKIFDSYVWNLSVLVEKNSSPLFDLVFLDGSHDFTIDFAAAYLLKILLKKGGRFIIDDINLSFNEICIHNIYQEKKFLERYSADQLAVPHMQKIVHLLFDSDSNFKKINTSIPDDTVIYEKLS